MEDEILQILKEINPLDEVNEDTILLGDFLDSTGLLLLINELEEKYHIEIPLERLELDYFKDVAGIVDFVNGLRTNL